MRLQSRFARVLLLVLSVGVSASPAPATETEAKTKQNKLSDSAKENLKKILNYNTDRGLTDLVNRARVNRAIVDAQMKSGYRGPAIRLPTAVQGTRAIPVLLAKFADSKADPFPPANLQQELFGSWPTGTMTQYYQEISDGKFSVTGKVSNWITLPQTGVYYGGPEGCHAMCDDGLKPLGEMLRDLLTRADAAIDFAQYDNNGPDNRPNSGDDDGFVDFVAIVQPEVGGECGTDDHSVWSHRWSLTQLTGSDFETNDVGKSGQKIRIDDYVIMPSLSCDASQMIQIGVFAHEFGHAFGLPDLYDTSNQSEGVGGWDLMGSGSWGGLGTTPETPSHMSAWSKEFLGWVTSKDIKADTKDVKLPPVETSRVTYKIDIDDDRALLIENRAPIGFDKSIPAAGLLVWSVKNSVIRPGLKTNQVNANPDDAGLAIIEADGANQLYNSENRGDDGDVFPGAARNSRYDAKSKPTTFSKIALCNIRTVGQDVVLDVLISTNQCPN